MMFLASMLKCKKKNPLHHKYNSRYCKNKLLPVSLASNTTLNLLLFKLSKSLFYSFIYLLATMHAIILIVNVTIFNFIGLHSLKVKYFSNEGRFQIGHVFILLILVELLTITFKTFFSCVFQI